MAGLNSSLIAIATAATLAVGPVQGATAPVAPHENVTAATRQKVKQLKVEFPQFKLSDDAALCLEDKLIDPDCDSAIEGEADIYKKKQQINAREQQINVKEQQVNARQQQVNARQQQVNAREQQINIVRESMDSISIVIGLIQLGLYIDYDSIPSKGGDYMVIVMENPRVSAEIKDLFANFLQRKKSGGTFTWKGDGEKLMAYARSYLDKAEKLQSQITDTKTKGEIATMYSQANTIYAAGIEKLVKKS